MTTVNDGLQRQAKDNAIERETKANVLLEECNRTAAQVKQEREELSTRKADFALQQALLAESQKAVQKREEDLKQQADAMGQERAQLRLKQGEIDALHARAQQEMQEAHEKGAESTALLSSLETQADAFRNAEAEWTKAKGDYIDQLKANDAHWEAIMVIPISLLS